MNLITKFKNFLFYKNVLDENRKILLDKYNIRIDYIYRMYTVYNIDKDEYDKYGGEPEIKNKEVNETLESFLNNHTNVGKIITGDKYFEAKVNDDLYRLEQFLISKGLIELFGLTEKKRLDRYNMKCVVEYKYLNTQFLANLSLFLGSVIIFSIIFSFFMVCLKLFTL